MFPLLEVISVVIHKGLEGGETRPVALIPYNMDQLTTALGEPGYVLISELALVEYNQEMWAVLVLSQTSSAVGVSAGTLNNSDGRT